MSAAAPASTPPVAPSTAPGSALTPQTTQQLMDTATQQIQSQIGAATAPYQSQIDLFQKEAGQAQGDISNEYAGLLPQVAASAQQVQNSNLEATQAAQSIFQAAGTRLNDLAQQSAKEAQDMAQQIGGPVGGVGLFSEGLTPYMEALPSAEAGDLLNALGLSQAGSQMAERFAGAVFPAMQTEDEAKARNFFNDKIATAQDQINQINAQKMGLVNDRYSTLLDQERSFELNLQQQKLDKLKSDRDWQVQQHTLRNDDARLALAEQDAKLRTAGVTGTYGGKPTLAADKFAAQTRQRAQALGIQAERLAVLQNHYAETDAIAKQRADVQQRTNAMSLLDAAMGYGKAITLTKKQVLAGPQLSGAILAAASGKRVPDTWYDKNTGQWYQYQRVSMTPQQWAQQGGVNGSTHITDPNQLYSILIGSGVNKGVAESLIKARTGLGDWTPGKQVAYQASDLAQKSLDELRGLATQRGMHNPTKIKGKQPLIDYIMAHNPQQQTDPTAPPGGQ